MIRFAPWLIAATLSLTTAPAAQALCTYRGELYGQTTLQQEFTDARWVVKARVLSAVNGGGGDAEYWTIYELETLSPFKGEVPQRFSLFTERNSGGFYLDRGAGGPDLGADYLLFLNPTTPRPAQPAVARRSMSVNYSCGQSRRWAEVDTASAVMLEALAARAAAAR